jgi:hypothetical protein
LCGVKRRFLARCGRRTTADCCAWSGSRSCSCSPCDECDASSPSCACVARLRRRFDEDALAGIANRRRSSASPNACRAMYASSEVSSYTRGCGGSLVVAAMSRSICTCRDLHHSRRRHCPQALATRQSDEPLGRGQPNYQRCWW